jgi:hypothetical protein
MIRAGRVDYPGDGTLRVSWDPTRLEGTRRVGQPGPSPAEGNRFDDPLGEFLVRYTADRLRGCLVETMSRFRSAPTAETVLASIDGVEDGDFEPDGLGGLQDWLGQQKIASIRAPARVIAVDIDAAETLVDLPRWE